MRNLISHIQVSDYFRGHSRVQETDDKLIIISEDNESLDKYLMQELLYKNLYLTDINMEQIYLDEFGDECKGIGYVFTHTNHFILSEA